MYKRTDLAVEAKELSGETDIEGVDYSNETKGDIKINRMWIKSEEASKKLEKPVGNYITIDVPSFTDNVLDMQEYALYIADEIKNLIPKDGLVFVVGLGNTEITPDNFGPKTVSKVLATRHIKGEFARAVGLDELRSVAAISPGVLGQTGIESTEILKSLSAELKPCAIIAIDALASLSLNRLGSTIQISDTGISPGAGVGNMRPKIDESTLGIPVIAVGVPTVVDALTLVSDILQFSRGLFDANHEAEEIVSPNGEMMMVTPREIDLLIDRSSALVSLSINCALQESLKPDDIVSLMS